MNQHNLTSNITDYLTDRLAHPAERYAQLMFNKCKLVLPEDDTHPLHELYWALVAEYELSRIVRAASNLTNAAIQDQDDLIDPKTLIGKE